MTTTEILTMDRGTGKTTRLLDHVISFPWLQTGPSRLVLVPHARAVRDFTDTALRRYNLRARTRTRDMATISFGDRCRIVVSTRHRLLLGDLAGYGPYAWVDEIGLLPEGCYTRELAPLFVVLVTATPAPTTPFQG